MKSLSLAGHTALVTGSTKGIGAAIADGLAESGAMVIRHGRAPANAADRHFVARDLSNPENAAGVMEASLEIAPALDLLICNAGSFFDVPFLQMDSEKWEQTMRLNVQSPYFLIQAFARARIAAGGGGAVVIVGSTNGFQAEDDSTAYDISKGALVMMVRSLAMALAPHGIRVNGMAPGLIRTPLTSGWMDRRPEDVAHYERKILLGRIGDSEDCAGACVFLCSGAASYITGQILVVDGGLTVGQIGRKP